MTSVKVAVIDKHYYCILHSTVYLIANIMELKKIEFVSKHDIRVCMYTADL